MVFSSLKRRSHDKCLGYLCYSMIKDNRLDQSEGEKFFPFRKVWDYKFVPLQPEDEFKDVPFR
jgi:hypothetical protein